MCNVIHNVIRHERRQNIVPGKLSKSTLFIHDSRCMFVHERVYLEQLVDRGQCYSVVTIDTVGSCVAGIMSGCCPPQSCHGVVYHNHDKVVFTTIMPGCCPTQSCQGVVCHNHARVLSTTIMTGCCLPQS